MIRYGHQVIEGFQPEPLADDDLAGLARYLGAAVEDEAITIEQAVDALAELTDYDRRVVARPTTRETDSTGTVLRAAARFGRHAA